MCTRVFLCDDTARIAGRTLDFSGTANPVMTWQPAAPASRHGETRIVRPQPAEDPVEWTSRHDVLAITDWDGRYLDGMNSAGLAAHALMYTTAGYEPPDTRPTLGTGSWVRFVVESCATGAEALDALSRVRVIPDTVLGVHLGVHLVMEDVTGDSAVMEPIDGHMVVHHGLRYRVTANSPDLETHLANLRRYRPFGGELPPPGDITSMDRFVRASYFLHYLPPPADARQAATDVMHVLETVAKPDGVPYPDGDVYPTRWLAAVDLVNLTYYFWSRTSPQVLWLDMADVRAARIDAQVTLMDPALAGDVSRTLLAGPDPQEGRTNGSRRSSR